MFVSILLLVMSMEIYVYCRAVQDDYVADTKFEYMYTYKYPGEEVPDGGYEAYAKTLKKEIYGYNFDVTVLGIKENNPFFDVTLSDSADKVTISSSISYKYGLKKGM
jgi:putative ABC transport system permease protein